MFIQRSVTNMRRMRSLHRLCVLVPILLLPAAVSAHHSFTAEFTAEETATLKGVVSEVWFRNPHVRYVFTVTNEDGVEETWDARGSPVVWLARKGWKSDTIQVGDTVTFYGYLGRDGRKLLSIMTVTLEDGTVLIDKAPE